MTPAWRNSASTVAAGVAAAAVCERAARDPAGELPPFIATIGLWRESRRAIRANFRGLPKDSQVQHDHSRADVLFPPQQQVVGADVGSVADRDEAGHAELERSGALEQRDAQPAGLGEHR